MHVAIAFARHSLRRVPFIGVSRAQLDVRLQAGTLGGGEGMDVTAAHAALFGLHAAQARGLGANGLGADGLGAAA